MLAVDYCTGSRLLHWQSIEGLERDLSFLFSLSLLSHARRFPCQARPVMLEWR